MHSLPWRQLSEPAAAPRLAGDARELRLPAKSSALVLMRRWVEDAAAEFGLDPMARYQFVFAVNEAVTNAIKHGRPDQHGTIGVRVHGKRDTLICTVRDSGQFVHPREDPDPMSERGRGFAFMTLLTDEVELSIEPDGTTVQLHKRRNAGAAPPRPLAPGPR